MLDIEPVLPVYAGVEQISINYPEERKVVEWCPFSELLSPVQGGAVGSFHTVLLTQDDVPSHILEKGMKPLSKVGALYATGSSNTGQLGLGNKYDQTTPQRVDVLFYGHREVLEVQSGVAHNIAIVRPFNTDITEIWTWGGGWYGRLGHGSERFQLKPKHLKSFSEQRIKVVQVCCGGNSTAALTDNGALYTWGYNKHGQLGLGTVGKLSGSSCQNGEGITRPCPAKVPSGHILVYVCMGRDHTMILTQRNQLLAAGSNEFGQLGMGMKMGSEDCKENEFKLVETQGISFCKVACGGEHTIALTPNGQVYAWGRVDKGRTGLEKVKQNVNAPRAVAGLQGIHVEKIFTGDAHNFVITKDKRVYSWGLNKYSQCGFVQGAESMAEAYQSTPRLLELLRGVDSILVGGNCAAGYSLFIITELKYLLWQHIRDLNVAQVTRILAIPAAQSILAETDEIGYTALHWACELGAKGIVSTLLRQPNANKIINLKSAGEQKNTALHICATKGYTDCVSTLLQFDASTQLVNEKGQTAVHLAVLAGFYDLAGIIVARANALGLPSPALIADLNGKTALQYCAFEDAYVLKQNTDDFFDIVLVFSAEQAILGEKLASFLEDNKIKCWWNKSNAHSPEVVLSIIDKSRAIVFVVGNSTVQEGSEEREILFASKDKNLYIFPIWHEKITLEPDMESIIFRFQLVDFSDMALFPQQGNILASAIKTSVVVPLAPPEVEKEESGEVVDTNAEIQEQVSDLFSEQTIFLSYVAADAAVAKVLLDFFEMQGEIQVFDSAVCTDSFVVSNAAKHCFAVLLIYSKHSMNSDDLRYQISVAENNKKPLYAIQVGKHCMAPIDFRYALAITPLFVYHEKMPQESVNQITRAMRLRFEVDKKSAKYKELLAEVQRVENLYSFAKSHYLDAIGHRN